MKLQLLCGPLLAGCALCAAPLAAQDDTFGSVDATLAGDGGASGTFEADLDGESGDVCYTLTFKGVDKPTGAHIRLAADNSTAVDLGADNDGQSHCANAPTAAVLKIIAKPGDYYVSVETMGKPNGAATGTLKGEDD